MCRRFHSNVMLFAATSLACFLSLVTCRSYNNGLIFYDLKTFQPYLPPTVSVSRGRGLANVKFSEKGSIWSTFGKPCECRKNLCGCCAGIKVKQYNFDQKMCANVTFVPPKEEALLEVYLNEKPSSKYGISVRNPSPFCIPVMMGIPMAMCVQMSDITIKGNNLNMCMDFIVRLATTDLFEMHFQCMLMGLDGFQYIDKDGQPVIPPGNAKNDAAATDDDYYDYEADENEISYGISEPIDSEKVSLNEGSEQQQQEHQIANSLNAISATGDGSYATASLQHQMQQLQTVQQYDIEKNDFLPPIDAEAATTTLAPIVVEAESEPDFVVAITTTDETSAEYEDESKTVTPQAAATETEAETLKTEQTLTSPTMNPVDNDYDNDAPSNKYNDAPSTTTVEAVNSASLSTTTATPVSKPIAAPTNDATKDATIAKDSTIDSSSSAYLKNITDNYAAASNDDVTNVNINFVQATTTAAQDDESTAAYIVAPDTATVAVEAGTINSTNEEDYALPIATASNAYSTVEAPTTTSALKTTTKPTALPAVNLFDNATSNVVPQPETPSASSNVDNSYKRYRHFYG